MFYFHIWYRNLQNFSLAQEDKQWKHENVESEQCFWYNFFSIFGVSEDFEAFCSVRLRKFLSMNLILMLCVFNVQFLFTNYVKCSLFGSLFVFKNLYCVATTEDVSMGEIVKFVSGSSSISNLGLFGKLKVQLSNIGG